MYLGCLSWTYGMAEYFLKLTANLWFGTASDESVSSTFTGVAENLAKHNNDQGNEGFHLYKFILYS